jgi:uncharacterized protein
MDEEEPREPKQEALNAELSDAAASDNLELVGQLMDRGADPEWQTPDIFGVTVLIRATRENRCDMVRLLLQRGARMKGRCKSRWCAIHWAAQAGNLEALKVLVEEFGADVQHRSGDGLTPLYTAYRSGPRAAAVIEYLEANEEKKK